MMTTIGEFRKYNCGPAETIMNIMLELGKPEQWLMNRYVFQYLYDHHLTDWFEGVFQKHNLLFCIPIKICSEEDQPLTLTVRQVVERSIAGVAGRDPNDDVLCHMDYVL